MLNLTVITGLVVRDRRGFVDHEIAFYGMDEVRFLGPVGIGDTLKGIVKVSEKEKKEKGGLVTLNIKGINQKDEEILAVDAKLLVRTKESKE